VINVGSQVKGIVMPKMCLICRTFRKTVCYHNELGIEDRFLVPDEQLTGSSFPSSINTACCYWPSASRFVAVFVRGAYMVLSRLRLSSKDNDVTNASHNNILNRHLYGVLFQVESDI